jgi:hypothetical protein
MSALPCGCVRRVGVLKQDPLSMSLLYALVLALSTSSAWAAACPAESDASARGKLCAQLGLRNGKVVVRTAAFWIPAAFEKSLAPSWPLERAQMQLRGQLEKIVDALPSPYQAALAPGENGAALQDAASVGLKNFTGAFTDFEPLLDSWCAAVAGRKCAVDMFVDTSDFFAPLLTASGISALIYDDARSSIDQGAVVFRFPNPFQSASVTLNLPNVKSAAQQARLRELRKTLAPLDGTLWDGTAIRERLAAYYQRLGLASSIVVGDARNNLVQISEGQRIAQIALVDPDVTDHDVDKILWIVLSEGDFRRAMKRRPTLTSGARVLDFRDLGYALGDEPYALTSRLQEQQLMLSQIGFVASEIPDTSRSGTAQQYVDLQIRKPASQPPPGSATPKAAPSGIDAHGQVGGNREHTAPAETSASAAAPDEKDKPWYVGGGFSYLPAKGFRVFGLLQRSRLRFPFENGSLSGEVGYPWGSLRSLNYAADYLAFERLHQRFSVRLTGSTDVDRRRFLLGRQLDERRSGGFGQLVWEPFHDWGGGLLRVTTEVRRDTVGLSSNTGVFSKLNLSTLRMDGVYQFDTVLSLHPRRVKLEPFVETGLDLASAERPFAVAGASGNYHQLFGAVAADITGHLKSATRDTPLIELPSFGGAEVVRGFRSDDAVGRRVWSLQNELWVPLPSIGAAPTQIQGILSQLRLAPFFDFGGAYQTIASAPGLRAGPGLGLRYEMNKIIVKLDWAYGFGDAATPGRRGKFYFTFISNLPF